MKTKHHIIIACVALVMIALFTNPTIEDYKQKIKETFTTYSKKSIPNDTKTEENTSILGNFLGKSLINAIVENAITVDNYFIFSLARIAHNGEENLIAYGFFGTIFLIDNIDETLNRSIKIK
ncbi:DUF4359 domain-containing protein [Flavobacterium sp.]|uniref:DUF4359 domain-containing protein n=1 Tax=Flavobacterium sp. TaxID=239 RepID=UPI0035296BDF